MRRRAVTFLSVALLAAGCYQQAQDDFQTIDSQNVQPTTGSGVIIIDPNASNDADSAEGTPIITDMELTATAIFAAPTNTPDMIDSAAPTTPAPDATATIRIIVPPSNGLTTPTQMGETSSTDGSLVPTATLVSIITPAQQSQIDFPTPTPGGSGDTGNTSSSNGLASTPTAIGEIGDASCVYVIESGDTLFRIALNDDRFTLAELLTANNLSEASIIQPGQELVIPNCAPGSEESVFQPPISQPAGEATSSVPAGSTVHIVASGDTLYGIALAYGVTVDDIVAANDLANPDALSLGQQLIIPQN
ncbi:MAG: LysM peptidoglycan-binding domain-containing protein [Anaerolineae bacterium]|nr:LysM peptidoglycan-binding domain-containing protein [Anaerolineae bacterium]